MGLPADLLPYAENLYRRFPEEFVALGMPGLEEVYDLRPSGTWSKRMYETPFEKTVEITIRRWNSPPLGGGFIQQGYPPMQMQLNPLSAAMPGSMYYQQQAFALQQQQQQQQQQAAAVAAIWQQQQQQQQLHHPFQAYIPMPGAPMPPQASAAPQAYMPMPGAPMPPQFSAAPQAEDLVATARLTRLESALSALKPQIEALLVAQMAAVRQASEAQAKAAPPPVTTTPAPSASGAAHSMGNRPTSLQIDTGVHAAAAAASLQAPASGPSALTDGLSNKLKDRRLVGNLQIQTVPAVKAQETPVLLQPTAVKPNENGDSDERASSADVVADTRAERRGNGSEEGRKRPNVNINAIRVAPCAMDPASPRSPGRFSAWK